MDKDCKNCIYSEQLKISKNVMVCKYPIPACIKINAGGGFLSGIEARDCDLYKTIEMVEAEKAKARMEAEEV